MRMRRATPGPGTGLAVGIDLGTTYSAVARLNELGKPELLPNREGEHITPSVVLFDGEQPIVGSMAKRSVVAAPLDVVQFVKRSMGDPSWRFETTGGTSYRPEEISALILKRLKEDAERALGAEVTDAVITVPAYFDDGPRRATIDAGTIAGLNVRRVLNEPTAAALAYGHAGGNDGKILVYDLGGGTFDVTALQIRNGEFKVLATHGDRNLGGFDFDNELMRLINERFTAAGGPDLLSDDATEADLRERTELAKHTLSTADRTNVTLTAAGMTKTVPVTRAEFETACAGLLGRTRDVAEMVVEEAGLTWNRIDRILLAGGSTRMPMVSTMLHDLSGLVPDAAPNPDEIVAKGAAIQADLLDRHGRGTQTQSLSRPINASPAVALNDVTSHGLGEILVRSDDQSKFNTVIIPKNSPIPARGSTEATTLKRMQRTITTRITQGDDSDLRYVRIVGTQRFPIPLYHDHLEIETVLAYDESQTIYVEINDLTFGNHIGSFEVENVDNMSQQELSNASAKIRRLAVD